MDEPDVAIEQTTADWELIAARDREELLPKLTNDDDNLKQALLPLTHEIIRTSQSNGCPSLWRFFGLVRAFTELSSPDKQVSAGEKQWLSSSFRAILESQKCPAPFPFVFGRPEVALKLYATIHGRRFLGDDVSIFSASPRNIRQALMRISQYEKNSQDTDDLLPFIYLSFTSRLNDSTLYIEEQGVPFDVGRRSDIDEHSFFYEALKLLAKSIVEVYGERALLLSCEPLLAAEEPSPAPAGILWIFAVAEYIVDACGGEAKQRVRRVPSSQELQILKLATELTIHNSVDRQAASRREASLKLQLLRSSFEALKYALTMQTLERDEVLSLQRFKRTIQQYGDAVCVPFNDDAFLVSVVPNETIQQARIAIEAALFVLDESILMRDIPLENAVNNLRHNLLKLDSAQIEQRIQQIHAMINRHLGSGELPWLNARWLEKARKSRIFLVRYVRAPDLHATVGDHLRLSRHSISEVLAFNEGERSINDSRNKCVQLAADPKAPRGPPELIRKELELVRELVDRSDDQALQFLETCLITFDYMHTFVMITRFVDGLSEHSLSMLARDAGYLNLKLEYQQVRSALLDNSHEIHSYVTAFGDRLRDQGFATLTSSTRTVLQTICECSPTMHFLQSEKAFAASSEDAFQTKIALVAEKLRGQPMFKDLVFQLNNAKQLLSIIGTVRNQTLLKTLFSLSLF